jgi:hypothetical protein
VVGPAAGGDRVETLAVVLGFSTALGIATVAVPLAALAAGHGPATIGLLVAASAASQLAIRVVLPAMLGRYPDRRLIGGACALMGVGFVVLVMDVGVPAFVLAQVVQGAARGIFWTSGSTHVVRGAGGAVRELVDMNMVGSTGTLAGPALGGSLAAVSLPLALVVGAVLSIVAAAGSLRLRPLAPFDRRTGAGTVALLRRRGTMLAWWTGIAGGAWWSMMGSFIPVILVGAGLGPAAVGWSVTASEGAATAVHLVLRRLAAGRLAPVLRLGGLTVSAVLVAIALVPGEVPAIIALLVVGGAASGIVTTLGPALASVIVAPSEQGDAIALSGTFRAGALLGAPAAVSALLPFLGLPAALALVAATIGVPGLIVGRRGSRERAD